MKKIIGVSFALVVSAFSFAQSNEQIQNKNGVDIMPVSGEWGVGMNALPMINFLGNSFNGNVGNFNMNGNKFVSYWASNTLFGKYMLSDNTALRAQLRIGQYNNTYDNWVFDDAKNDPDSLVLDQYKSAQSFYNIGVGYEWRRGKTRLRGIYGGEVMYMFTRGAKSEYTYGNALGLGNSAPTSTTWLGTTPFSETPLAARTVSQTGGNFNGVGVRGFIGVEYYIAPKICFGTEFGWGVMYGATGSTETRTEWYDPTANAGVGAATFSDVKDGGSRGLSIDTDNFGGSLYMMFYF